MNILISIGIYLLGVVLTWLFIGFLNSAVKEEKLPYWVITFSWINFILLLFLGGIVFFIDTWEKVKTNYPDKVAELQDFFSLPERWFSKLRKD